MTNLYLLKVFIFDNLYQRSAIVPRIENSVTRQPADTKLYDLLKKK